MNRKELSKLKGNLLRLRPIARVTESTGQMLEYRDDVWLVQDASPDGVTLSNARSGHTIFLNHDHIHEYRSDCSGESNGFLLLQSEIRLKGKKATVEPFHYRHSLEQLADVVANLESQLDESLRLAKGAIIEGPSPLRIFLLGEAPCIEVNSFGVHFLGMDSTVYYSSGSISGLSPDTTYYVYGMDAERSGGAIVYLATPNRWEALIGAGTIYIGRISVPQA
jgi:hypothetical protein